MTIMFKSVKDYSSRQTSQDQTDSSTSLTFVTALFPSPVSPVKMSWRLPYLLLLLAVLTMAHGQAIFDGYEVQFSFQAAPGRLRLAGASANISASSTASSNIIAVTGSALWKATVYASQHEDGTGKTEVFQIYDSSLSFVPGEYMYFQRPLEQNIDLTVHHHYLCVKLEKANSANPDFNFVFGEKDEANLCHVTPENVQVAQALFEGYDVQFSFDDEPGRNTITGASANILASSTASSKIVAAAGSALWKITVYASHQVDGSGVTEILESYNSSLTYVPGEKIYFIKPLELELDLITDYHYVCFKLEKADFANPDFDFVLGEVDKANLCRELPAMDDLVSCHLWGDPHTKTFDGYGYTHQGYAEYIAVTTCHNEDKSVPDFEIVVDNFRRKPSIPVTYIREVRLYYNDVVYALTHPDEVTVDGEKVTPPYMDENGVKIIYGAPNKVLRTNFGLVIRFDNNYDADVSLPSRFMNKVCGLCGNFDGDRSNECQFRDGTLMKVHNEECKLNHSIEWTYKPSPPTWPEGFKPALRKCDEDSEYLVMAMAQCGIITDPLGPLSACIAVVDPMVYYTTCVYDLCQLLPEVFFLCASVQTYIMDCGRVSNFEVAVDDWRSMTPGCEPSCPENMIYNPRGKACQETCTTIGHEPGSFCPFPAIEVCQCPEGMVLDGTKCVNPNECGCKMDSGRYLSVGEKFVAKDCSESCTCVAANDLECHPMTCAEDAHCDVKVGERTCYCNEGYLGDGLLNCTRAGKVCHIYGDPHFHAFDHSVYSFQGDCTYTAVKSCAKGVTPFRILIHNDALIPEERFTYLTMISLHFKGQVYRVKHNGEVLINHVNYEGSFRYEDPYASVYRDGKNIVIESSIGVEITYDGENAWIRIPPEYFDKVCGLCGNADGDPENDKRKPDGTLAKKKEFANSWSVGNCPDLDEEVDTCEPGTQDYNDAVDVCSLIAQSNGPFSYCHVFSSPFEFVKTCIYDLCGTLPSTRLFCSSAEAYLKACAEKGGRVPNDWDRNVKYCGSTECPEGYTEYQQSCYKYYPTQVIQAVAKETCMNDGGYLALITTAEENDFVGSLAENQRAWIGAERNPAATTTDYDSTAGEDFTFLPFRLSGGISSIRFSVKAQSDAHIILSTFKQVDDESPIYEIVLGAGGNQENLIRRCQTCQSNDQSYDSYLDENSFQDFFINFEGGNIQVGEMVDRKIIAHFKDPLPMRIRYVAFRTTAVDGTWRFYNREFRWETAEAWTFDKYRIGEPNNYDSDEDCVETNFVRAGIWNDNFCDLEKGFICEKDGQ